MFRFPLAERVIAGLAATAIALVVGSTWALAQAPAIGPGGGVAAPPGGGLLSPAPAPRVGQMGPTLGIVREIRIEGTQRVDPETVRSYMAIGIGDPFEPERIDDTVKQLFATGLFADVRVQRDGDALIVAVDENPIINRIAFEGNSSIEDRDIAAEVQSRSRAVFTRTRVQSDVNRILELYRRSGRFGAQVEPKIIELPQNRVDLVFEIEEGDRTRVRNIVFVGNRRFSDRALRGEIRTEESRWWRFFSSGDIYDPDRLAVDRELLRRFYLANGYADFRVVSAVAELTPDRSSFIVTFTVDEGERYRFGEIDVVSRLDEVSSDWLRPMVRIRSGDWYDSREVESAVDALTEEIGKYGFAFVDVRPRVRRNRDELTIDLTLEVGEGPRVYVNRIDIEGNVRTLDPVIRREFELVEGDAFNSARIQASERRIRNLNFFERVEIKTEPADEPDRMNIVVDVQEQSTGEISIGAGFSTAAGALADFSISEANLLGRGQSLRLGFMLSQRTQLIDFSFTEPYFLDRNMRAGFDVFNRLDDLQDESSFERRSMGFALRTGYRIQGDLSQDWSYTLRRDKISPGSLASRFIQAEAGTQTFSAIGQALTYDGTDSTIDPTRGFRGSWSTEVAGLGGSVRHISNELSAWQYFPVFSDLVLSVGARGGYIYGIGQNVRLNQRFQLGGERLRGFAIGGVGPRDSATGDALGGNYYYTGTVELSYPLPLLSEIGMRGRVFGEVGSLDGIDEPDKTGIQMSSALRGSAGVGISWASPFGPIRIDASQAILKESFDRTETIYFSFGTRF